MAPYTFAPGHEAWLTVLVGFFFGFVLERAGFGNARNLAAQFYLHNMRVLKVMFTAIVTAMLFVFLTSGLGLLNFELVHVPPTYLWSGIVGGLSLGVGFIIGGYCPGTSLVSLSTWKVDGLFYVAGVLFGLFVFDQTVPWMWNFFNHGGALGRLTISDLLGIDAGWVVLGVTVMAIGAFAFAEFLERRLAGAEALAPPTRGQRLFRRAAVAVGVAVGTLVLMIGQPTVSRKMAWAQTALDAALRQRRAHIDPAEALGLMRNNQVQLALVDVRSEREFQVFHLLDAQRVTLAQLERGWAARLPSTAIVVVMSNDERAAEEAWKRLAVQLSPNPRDPGGEGNRTYILAGGINRWLDLYRERAAGVPGPDAPASGDDRCRHAFSAALGDRQGFSRPEAEDLPRKFPVKVKVVSAKRRAGGGCG